MGIGNELVGDLERLLTMRVLRRQSLFRMTGSSSECWRAEAELEQLHPGLRCLLLPSATIGLALLLEALALKPGTEVLITPFGWLSNWSCLHRARLVPRFMPLDGRLQLQVEDVEARLTDRTGAVVVTHLMGRGHQAVGDIARVCGDRGIPLLEDIAQSFGVSIHGRRAGTFGTGAWCSLNHHKLLSTGDGGFALVRDRRTFETIGALHDQGCIMKDGTRRPAAVVEPGLSLRVTELTAAVLRAQLARFHFVRARILRLHRAVTDVCQRELRLDVIPPNDGDLPFTVLFSRPATMRYPSLADSGWHVAANVPWLEQVFRAAAQADAAVAETGRTLATTSAVGAAFVDPYYAVPVGLPITASQDEAPGLLLGRIV